MVQPVCCRHCAVQPVGAVNGALWETVHFASLLTARTVRDIEREGERRRKRQGETEKPRETT